MVRVNWEDVLTSKTNRNVMTKFAAGELSGRQLQESFVGTNVSGEIRSLIRPRGVRAARDAARKALQRRNLLV